jgi:hypothetical protein
MKTIRPGDPHYFRTRLDRRASRLIMPLCRCTNPQGHGDAWTFINMEKMRDIRGDRISWKQLMNRVLDYYVDKTTVSREEELAAFPYILNPWECADLTDHYEYVNYGIGQGWRVFISPYEDDVQMHNADGHMQNNVTESGLQTQIERPGGGDWRSSYGHTRR